MRHVLVNPPSYGYDMSAQLGEYPIALMKLASYLKAQGDKVELFDFQPYKYFQQEGFVKMQEDVFKTVDARPRTLFKSFITQQEGKELGTYYVKTGEYVTRCGQVFERVYFGEQMSVFEQFLKVCKPAKIWVTSGMTYGFRGVREVVDVCKLVHPGVPVTLGGIYPTLCYEHARANTKADHVISGDYGEIEHYPQDYSIFPNVQYIIRQLSKGCPNNCKFCAVTYLDGTTVRFVDIDKDIAEIMLTSEKYGVDKIKIWASNLLIPRAGKCFEEWLDKLVATGKKWHIICPEGFAPELLTPALCKKMIDAGFDSIIIPLEDAGSRLKDLGKSYTFETWQRTVKGAMDLGVPPERLRTPIIIGTPGQTVDDVLDFISVIKGLQVRPIIYRYTPVPKSVWYEESSRFQSMDLEHCNGALYPSVNNAAQLARFKGIEGYLERIVTDGYETKGGVMGLNEGQLQELSVVERLEARISMVNDLFKKIAPVVLDIALQNEEILKRLAALDVPRKIENPKETVESGAR